MLGTVADPISKAQGPGFHSLVRDASGMISLRGLSGEGEHL